MDRKLCTGSFSYILMAQWDCVKKKNWNNYVKNPYSIAMDKRVDIRAATSLLLRSGKWKPYQAVNDIADFYKDGEMFPFSDDRYATKRPLYKEFLYFNSNMRQLIYNSVRWDECSSEERDKHIEWYAREVDECRQPVVVLEREMCSSNAYYHLLRLANKDLTAYRIPVSSIQLRLYSTGIICLAIRCCHEYEARWSCCQKKSVKWSSSAEQVKNVFYEDDWEQANLESDISWLQDAGRRLFSARGMYSRCFADYPSESPLYSGLELGNGEKQIDICNMLGLLEKEQEKKNENRIFPEHFEWLKDLISEECLSAKNAYRLQMDAWISGKNKLVIDSFNDDRMYLHGTIVSDSITADMIKVFGTLNRGENAVNQIEYLSVLRRWYGMLAADSNWDSSSCTDPNMLVQLVEKSTDTRWSQWGTFYGVTYHSMIMLHDANAPAYLTENMDWMYFQMFLIGILQRCSLQRFYREASGALQIHDHDDKKRRSALKDSYLLFLNRIWFSEVTEQEQGRDLFGRLQDNLSVKEDVAFLDEALEELSEREQKRLDSTVNDLLLPMSVVGGIWAAVEMMVSVKDRATIIMSKIPQGVFPVLSEVGSSVVILIIFVCLVKFGYHSIRRWMK